MQKAVISITRYHDICNIKVKGRATLECSPPLRELAKNLAKEGIEKVNICLEECTGMDSTFMGVITMLTLELNKKNNRIVLYNASENNKNLLIGIGLKDLVEFKEGEPEEKRKDETEEQKQDISDNEVGIREKAETILEAHENLINLDKKNAEKFTTVVDMLKRDINKLDKKNNE